MAISKKALLSILTKLKIEFTDKISDTRAQKKLERAIKKNGGILDGVDFTDKEMGILTELGLADPAEEEGEAAEEKPAKKKGKKSKKGKKKKGKMSREANIPLMKRLIAEGKSEKEIKEHFYENYKESGHDKEWIDKRIDIYRSLATGEKRSRKKKETTDVKKKSKKTNDKTEKSTKSKKSSKTEKVEKPAKKVKSGKKKAKDEEE